MRNTDLQPLAAVPTIFCVVGLLFGEASAQDPTSIFNAGFEEASFEAWPREDVALPLIPLAVAVAGGDNPAADFFRFEPTEGQFAVRHGFDGNGPGTILLERPLQIIPVFSTLQFDYRAAWDLTSPAATSERSFRVEIRRLSGNILLETFDILAAPPGTRVTDTGPITVSLDLSGIPEQIAQVRFLWEVPQAFTGPGHFLFDNVRLSPTGSLKGTRARLKLDFKKGARDSLKLKMNVAVPADFAPEDQTVHVAIGRYEMDVVLDRKGRSKSDTHALRMKPMKSDPLTWKLSLKLRRVQLTTDLARWGYIDADVPKPGVKLSLPLLISVGGLGTEVVPKMIYSAKAGKKGSARSRK